MVVNVLRKQVVRVKFEECETDSGPSPRANTATGYVKLTLENEIEK